MSYRISDIASILEASPMRFAAVGADTPALFDPLIEDLLVDSRKVYAPGISLFFALKGERRDGHQFLDQLYRKGVRAFVVSESPELERFPGAVFILVDDTLMALQELAAWHRRQFAIPVIGITGSNGKTIVKEWLCQLLQDDHQVVRSPRSYNSQTGVPLSVWQMNAQHTLAIFEAGISRPGEMERLEYIIQPSTGIFTHLGNAHSEGFSNMEEKAWEKLQLFLQTGTVIYNNESETLNHAFGELYKAIYHDHATPPQHFTWGRQAGSSLQVISTEQLENHTVIHAVYRNAACSLTIRFIDHASVENAITCWCVLLQLGYTQAVIDQRMLSLQAVNMRLEVRDGINQCTIINDSYSADPDSLQIALDFLEQQSQGLRKTVILSDLLQSDEPDVQLYAGILQSLSRHQVGRLIAIGPRINAALNALTIEGDLVLQSYASTDAFLQQMRSSQFREEIILVKGARVFGFEQIVQQLQHKAHQTLLEINLNAIIHNLKVFQQQLLPSTKIMAMVKAFAYGAGGAEIAGILQYHQADYLGVAYADEGVELRKAGITMPIMVMNAEPRTFESIVEYNLEPDLYSIELLDAFEKFVSREGLSNYPVHLEIETGMNRLGLAPGDLPEIGTRLAASGRMQVQSVFSHLAASDDPAEDPYTLRQYQLFMDAADTLKALLPRPFLRHISNSAAISRLPQLQLDMVRLGIGLYGVDSSGEHQASLIPAATLRSTIAQVKQLRAGDTVSYNRRGKLDRDSVTATVRIGYADGYSRRLGNGVGKMLINGHLAPVIGSVNMDMTMLDVTGIPGVEAGDDVTVFGVGLPVQDVARWAGTIPYEIMTSVSQRVQRVYFEE